MTDRVACKLDERTLAMARAAGLDRALAEFSDCVADAARAAAQDLADMPAIEGVAEPWPSMRVRSAPVKDLKWLTVGEIGAAYAAPAIVARRTGADPVGRNRGP